MSEVGIESAQRHVGGRKSAVGSSAKNSGGCTASRSTVEKKPAGSYDPALRRLYCDIACGVS